MADPTPDPLQQTRCHRPQPFLGSLFEPGVEPVIASGYFYSQAEITLHGVKNHRAIDLALPRGTKIYAPADGWYVATYGEVLLTNQDDTPRDISLKQALTLNQLSDINPPSSGTAWPAYFGSYAIQGWHGQGRYTQYAHLDWVAPDVPYFPPITIEGNQDLKHHPILRAPLTEYKARAAFLRKGMFLEKLA